MRLIFVYFWFILVTFGCFDLGGGSNTAISETPDNSKSKRVILFLRQAGATVADSYQ